MFSLPVSKHQMPCIWGILALPLVSAVRVVYLFESVGIFSKVHLFLPDIYTHLCMSGRYKLCNLQISLILKVILRCLFL